MVGRDELRRRALEVLSQQLDLGWGGEFLRAVSLEVAAREIVDQKRTYDPARTI